MKPRAAVLSTEAAAQLPASEQPVRTLPEATVVGRPAGIGSVAEAPRARLSLPEPVSLVAAAPAAVRPAGPTFHPPVDDRSVTAPDRSIGVGQVICWQLALVAVGLATTSTTVVLVATTLAAVVAIVATAVRFHGVWLYRWAAVLLAFACRRRRTELPPDGALALIAFFCGRTSARTLTIRDQLFGVLSRPDAVSVVLRLGSGAHQDLFPRLGTLLQAAEEQPVGVAVQLVLHTGVREDRSVRAWVAVAARRTAEIATDDQLGQVLTNTVRRMVRRFDREQLTVVALDESTLRTSIGALAHANAGRGQLRERWSSWSAGPVQQVCLRLTGFAGLPVATAQELTDALLGTVTGSAQTLALTVVSAADGPTTEPVRYDAVLRVAAAQPATLDSALVVLGALARSYAVEPERLDGRHASGVAATLPLGVPLS